MAAHQRMMQTFDWTQAVKALDMAVPAVRRADEGNE
jgi:hypothetical protein